MSDVALSGSIEAAERHIGLAQVLAGAIPFKEGNINDTYRGIVLTDAGERTAIIKDLEVKELANELLGAALASDLGLPVPPAYLAFAHPERLQATKGPMLDSGRLLFASLDVQQPQVAMLYNGGGGKRILERLAQWRAVGLLYGFDALVANIDRHAGNILFSGDREVWLIDHGWCFTGPSWKPDDFSPPDKTVRSRLMEWLTPALDKNQRQAAASQAATIETQAEKMNLRGLAIGNYVADLLTGGDLEAVLSFLSARCRHVPRLAAKTLDIPVML